MIPRTTPTYRSIRYPSMVHVVVTGMLMDLTLASRGIPTARRIHRQAIRPASSEAHKLKLCLANARSALDGSR